MPELRYSTTFHELNICTIAEVVPDEQGYAMIDWYVLLQKPGKDKRFLPGKAILNKERLEGFVQALMAAANCLAKLENMKFASQFFDRVWRDEDIDIEVHADSSIKVTSIIIPSPAGTKVPTHLDIDGTLEAIVLFKKLPAVATRLINELRAVL